MGWESSKLLLWARWGIMLTMTTQTLGRTIKGKKSGQPAVIKEGGTPRYVVLDWQEYQRLRDMQEEFLQEREDERELRDPKVQEIIREGMREYRAGKSRPLDDFLAELDAVRDRSHRRYAKKNS